jgi:hypothetical protein
MKSFIKVIYSDSAEPTSNEQGMQNKPFLTNSEYQEITGLCCETVAHMMRTGALKTASGPGGRLFIDMREEINANYIVQGKDILKKLERLNRLDSVEKKVDALLAVFKIEMQD